VFSIGHRGRAAKRCRHRGQRVRGREERAFRGRVEGQALPTSPARRADRARPSAAWTIPPWWRGCGRADPARVLPPRPTLDTGRLPACQRHPLPRLLDEGLFVTDEQRRPPMFGTTLTESTGGGLGDRAEPAQLAELAAKGVRASIPRTGSRAGDAGPRSTGAAGVGSAGRFRGNARLSPGTLRLDAVCPGDDRVRLRGVRRGKRSTWVCGGGVCFCRGYVSPPGAA